MARIAVVTSAPPLTEGGHLVHARVLVRAPSRRAGHEAGIIFVGRRPRIASAGRGSAYLANWATDVSQTEERAPNAPIDQVINDSVLELRRAASEAGELAQSHEMREYYDRWDEFSATLSAARAHQGRDAATRHPRRRHIYCFTHHVKKLFAVSATVRDRLQRWNGVAAEVLHPPAPPRPYRCDEYGDFLFFVSRLESLKRADLVIQAMAEPPARLLRLVLGGDGPERARLEALAADLGVSSRITFAGYLNETALVDYLARCRAVVFVPRDEDYGFVTAEAFESSKPVITCRDSGGPTELVTSDTGLVVPPTPSDLAAACAALGADQARAERLGQRAKARIATVTWARAVERLVLP